MDLSALLSKKEQRHGHGFVVELGFAACSVAVCAKADAPVPDSSATESQNFSAPLQILLSECVDAYSCR